MNFYATDDCFRAETTKCLSATPRIWSESGESTLRLRVRRMEQEYGLLLQFLPEIIVYLLLLLFLPLDFLWIKPFRKVVNGIDVIVFPPLPFRQCSLVTL